MAVYATWQSDGSFSPGTQWAANAVYTVYDVTADTTLRRTHGQPGRRPARSIAGAQRPAVDALGVWNVPVGDMIEVELSDSSYTSGDMLCAGDVMIHPLWVTVTCRAAGVTANPSVPNNPIAQGDYVDWVDACQGFDVPGGRVGRPVATQRKCHHRPAFCKRARLGNPALGLVERRCCRLLASTSGPTRKAALCGPAAQSRLARPTPAPFGFRRIKRLSQPVPIGLAFVASAPPGLGAPGRQGCPGSSCSNVGEAQD